MYLLFFNLNIFCEVPNYAFELNVCHYVIQKTFKKKINSGFQQGNKFRIPKELLMLPKKLYLNRNLTFTVNLN